MSEPLAPLALPHSYPWRGWIIKTVALPLIPAMGGAFIRFLISGELNLELLDPTEVAFSIALFCLLVAMSSKNIDDHEQSQWVFYLFLLGAVLSFLMYGAATIMSSQIDHHAHWIMSQVCTFDNNEGTCAFGGTRIFTPEIIAKSSVYADELTKQRNIIRVITWYSIVFGAVMIVTGGYCQDRYGLDRSLSVPHVS